MYEYFLPIIGNFISVMELDFKWDWKVILEFELNDFTFYVMLLGIKHNVLITKSTRI